MGISWRKARGLNLGRESRPNEGNIRCFKILKGEIFVESKLTIRENNKLFLRLYCHFPPHIYGCFTFTFYFAVLGPKYAALTQTYVCPSFLQPWGGQGVDPKNRVRRVLS